MTARSDPVDVTVILLTYQQADSVGAALESILEQDFAGRWEVLVADDASTDGTASLARRAAASAPVAVRVLGSTTNLGVQRNLRRAMQAARGDFLAYLEGDDVWTDPRKLTLQHRALAATPDRVAVAHRTAVWLDGVDTGTLFSNGLEERTLLTFDDVVRGAFPHFSSLFHRRSALPQTPRWFDEQAGADWLATALLARQAPIEILPIVASRYQRNDRSSWTPRPHVERKLLGLASARALELHLGDLGPGFRTLVAEVNVALASTALKERRWVLAARALRDAARSDRRYVVAMARGSLRRRARRRW